MFYHVLSYRFQAYLFAAFFCFFYLVSPLVIYLGSDADPYFLRLAELAAVGLVFMALGFFVFPALMNAPSFREFKMSGNTFIWSVFGFFVIFIIYSMVTAQFIPLVYAFKNRNPSEIAVSRAMFLKAREGGEIILVYMNSILTTSFVPYVILLSFVQRLRFRWWLLLLPYFYSFLFIEKAFFLKFILPFVSYCASFSQKRSFKKYVWVILISIPLVIFINTAISGFGSGSGSESESESGSGITLFGKPSITKCSDFYNADYILCANKGYLDFIAWRILAVPVFTASDSLKLFDDKYNHQLLMGKTSSLLSLITHQQNIKFEREVFKSEWGGEQTGTASANSVFIIEQYVNFGWLGVMLSSMLVGYIFAVLRRSKDDALASLAIIFSLCILFGGFISAMLSGGYLFLFIILAFTRLEWGVVESGSEWAGYEHRIS